MYLRCCWIDFRNLNGSSTFCILLIFFKYGRVFKLFSKVIDSISFEITFTQLVVYDYIKL